MRRTRQGVLATSAWGLVDQALISAMNFGTTVLLARTLGPAEFGMFSVAYLFLLLANSLQTGLVTQPHNVIGAPLEDGPYRNYTTSAAVGQVALAGAFTLLVLGGALVSPKSWERGASLLVALAAAIPAWQLQEFARRVLYTRSRVRTAFLNDLASYGGQLVVMLLLLRAGRLTAPAALFSIAATSAAAALAGFWSIRSHLRGRVGFTALRESWAIGKWLSAATLTSWLASQMYPVLTAGIVGTAATGLMRALQNLIAPTQILANAYQMIVTPRAALREARGGPPAVAAFLASTSAFLAAPLLVYFVLVSVFAAPLVTLFYSAQYASAASLVWPLGLALLLSYAGRVLGIGLATMRYTRPLFYGQVAAAVTTFTFGLTLIGKHGLAGAAWGAALTQAVLVVTLAWYFRRQAVAEGPRPAAVGAEPPPVVGV